MTIDLDDLRACKAPVSDVYEGDPNKSPQPGWLYGEVGNYIYQKDAKFWFDAEGEGDPVGPYATLEQAEAALCKAINAGR